ncbi:hypothetical protein PV328_002288 [Microctonus aethiopoides]|uniref:Uncharacterized protein n=1 Tax=Microctonus aethiopoides TaxID=144406 RepID=A0AA39KY84_9HYME|nr:hypothetical protein PV328_002288 [Microctonus aethiopoides]
MAARSYTAIIQPTGDSKSDYIAEAKVMLRANGNLQSPAILTNLKLVTIDEIESDVVVQMLYVYFIYAKIDCNVQSHCIALGAMREVVPGACSEGEVICKLSVIDAQMNRVH